VVSHRHPRHLRLRGRHAGLEYRIYDAKDLSTPVPPYFDETIHFTGVEGKPLEGVKHHLPEVPFYVRVFNPDRTKTGSYTLYIHRATCTSAEEACLVRANETVTHALPPMPVNADDTTWFQLRTEAADSGASQDLRFVVDGYNQDILSLVLLKSDAMTQVDADSDAEPNPGAPGTLRLEIARDDLDPGANTYYLVVKRANPAALTFNVRWETNLTVLHGALAGVPGSGQMNIYCVEETDTVGIDEVSLTVKVDGATVVNDVYIGDFDNGIYRTLEDLIPVVRYLDDVTVTLREEDGAANGDDDILSTTITPLAADSTQDLNKSTSIAGSGGKYLFRHNRSRSLSIDP